MASDHPTISTNDAAPTQTFQHEVTVPNTNYWREQIKCQVACPVHTDSRGYIRAIAEGNYELAYLIARGPNPLASICGRVCGAPCETACRRGEIDKPVAIRALNAQLRDDDRIDSVLEAALRIFARQDSLDHAVG